MHRQDQLVFFVIMSCVYTSDMLTSQITGSQNYHSKITPGLTGIQTTPFYQLVQVSHLMVSEYVKSCSTTLFAKYKLYAPILKTLQFVLKNNLSITI